MTRKRIICLDFDGVISSYKSGWTGFDEIRDPPTNGAIKWIQEFFTKYCLAGEYELHIFSARCETAKSITMMRVWLAKNGLSWPIIREIVFDKLKPAAEIIVDDRAIFFNGNFEGLTEKILTFEPWHKHGVWEKKI